MPVTETSVIIAVSSQHRQESLEAVHYAIDSLKATVPIWKKVYFVEVLQSKSGLFAPTLNLKNG